ncbi:MAG: 2'-5' RNA ligase family protein [Candidatus Kerfeldbacteria bacterium]
MRTQINSIAVDIVLLPPKDVMELCRSINLTLWQETKQGYRFDDTHIPHTSLFQCFIQPQHLNDLNEKLQHLVPKIPPFTFSITGIDIESLPGEISYSGFLLSLDDKLIQFQQAVDEVVHPFVTTGDASSFIADSDEKILQLSVDWVTGFRQHHPDGAHYQPHISLGVGKVKPLERPIDFTASRFAVCHLGNFNTCRKILKEWVLK